MNEDKKKKRKVGFLRWFFGRGSGSVKTGARGSLQGSATRLGASRASGALGRAGSSLGRSGGLLARFGLGRGILASKAGIIGLLVSGAVIGAVVFMLGGLFDKEDAYTKGLFESSVYSDTAGGDKLDKKASKALAYFSGLKNKVRRPVVEDENLDNLGNLSADEGENPLEYEDPAEALAEDLLSGEEGDSSKPAKPSFSSAFSSLQVAGGGSGSGSYGEGNYGAGAKGANQSADSDPVSRLGKASVQRNNVSRTAPGKTTAYAGAQFAKKAYLNEYGPTGKQRLIEAFESGEVDKTVEVSGEGLTNNPTTPTVPPNDPRNPNGPGGSLDPFNQSDPPPYYDPDIDNKPKENEEEEEDEGETKVPLDSLPIILGGVVGGGVGAGIGALLGGALIGLGIGAVIGGLIGFFVSKSKRKRAEKRIEEARKQRAKPTEDHLKNTDAYKDLQDFDNHLRR